MSESITFILGGPGRAPAGGYRIVYEYANRLCARGWTVNVVHPCTTERGKGLLESIRFGQAYWRRRLLRSYLPTPWFAIDPRVRMLWVRDLSESHIPDADYVVACPVTSAAHVNSYSTRKGKKFYFIQHFEDWAVGKAAVEETWKYPLRKIVIAKWLAEIAADLGEEADYVPNGLDFAFFKVITPIRERNHERVSFMYHPAIWKGSQFAIEAAVELRRRHPSLSFHAFSVFPPPAGCPSFVDFHHNPSQQELRRLYNLSHIFLAPSLSEGWGLPPCEAMMCGCVVIASDIGGHREFLQDGVNGLVCQPGSAEAIVEKVEFVLGHREAAHQMAERAPESLGRFDWGSSVARFENALRSP